MPTMTLELEATLKRAEDYARSHKQEYIVTETILLALLDDKDAAGALNEFDVDIQRLRQSLESYHTENLEDIRLPQEPEILLVTAGADRAMQRARLQAQAFGIENISGINLLAAILSEQQSYAAYYLAQQHFSRIDAVSYARGHRPKEEERKRAQEQNAESLLSQWIYNAFPKDPHYTPGIVEPLCRDKSLQDEIKALVRARVGRPFNTP
ncbi:MAG: hypothetical protein DI551_04170 [Micavibrio aeruginosavorus]|uniref:Clp R domain-containing protein n=1 Tax=Micavibrio aeruginosavorus TaxID=349221 RepID=A0A2W5N1K6_9BACT|nr:MAG: hypothetical protein DI551_04170 [Micavibrio aeruginosavorus]